MYLSRWCSARHPCRAACFRGGTGCMYLEKGGLVLKVPCSYRLTAMGKFRLTRRVDPTYVLCSIGSNEAQKGRSSRKNTQHRSHFLCGRSPKATYILEDRLSRRVNRAACLRGGTAYTHLGETNTGV